MVIWLGLGGRGVRARHEQEFEKTDVKGNGKAEKQDVLMLLTLKF